MAKQSAPAEKVATNDQSTGGSAGETLQNDAGETKAPTAPEPGNDTLLKDGSQTGEPHEHKGPVEGGETRAPAAPEPEDGEGEIMRMMVAEQVLVVSAPGGPRRRAGFSFGPVPVDLRWEELGANDDEREDALKRLRADPLLKIDGRMEERPADD